jgi:hypothetical protein
MKDDELKNRTIGLSAQQVQEVFPDAVSTIDEEGHLGLDYTQLIPATIEAIKELNTKIDAIDGAGLVQQVTDIYNEIKDFMDNLGLSTTPEGALLVDKDMSVLGTANFKDVVVSDDLSVGNINIESATNTIQINGAECIANETLCDSQTLHLQKNLAGNIDLFNGKVKMSVNGDIETVGTINAKKIITEEYSVKGTSKTIGNGILTTGNTEIVIPTTAIKNNSKVFITATNSTNGQAMFISNKVEGVSFTVSVDTALYSDVTFDWFIVNID